MDLLCTDATAQASSLFLAWRLPFKKPVASSTRPPVAEHDEDSLPDATKDNRGVG